MEDRCDGDVNDTMIRNTLSATTSGARLERHAGTDVLDNMMGRNTVSTTTSGVLSSFWFQLAQCLSGRRDEILWTQSPDEAILAVDTTVLNTLTKQELNKLMESVRQLHRRADPKVIAAASQLQCDECHENGKDG